MAAVPSRNRKKFLSDYDLDEDYLVAPDSTLGRPGLLTGRSPDGLNVLVKSWPIDGLAGFDLEQIWRSEIRQLQRLAAVPRAEELFVPMLASGEDKEGFHLVLSPGQGSPLETFRRARSKPTVLSQPTAPRNRRRLWSNIHRVAEALELLHSQGIIHRNVDPWSIISSFGDRPDFRLTGFEWSMRIATVDGGNAKRRRRADQNPVASFGRDWSNLGLIVAELIGAPIDRVTDLELVPSEIAEHLSAGEGQVLRSMLQLETAERLDGEQLCERIGNVVTAITAQAAGKEARLELAVTLGTGSRLSTAIRRASENEIEITDKSSQLAFVTNDLSQEPYFARIRKRESADTYFALLGSHLTYEVTAFRQPGASGDPDWEFVASEKAEVGRPTPGAIVGSTRIDAVSLNLSLAEEAFRSYPRKRGRVERWDEFLTATEPKEERKTELDHKQQAFALLLVLEMAYAAADVFPVEIVPSPNEPIGDVYQLRLASRFDPERAALATALDLEAPAIRLTQLLESEELRNEGTWTLSATGFLGERGEETDWRFVKQEESFTREVLLFEGTSPNQTAGAAFLTPPGMGGQIAQLKRRRKALKTLAQHTELLRMLVDARERIEDSHDPINEKDEEFKALDKSKQDALREILSTIPFFLLQGPPGVGKTYLVGEIVRRRFEDDPTTRMLLSAQSHAAIDHLMKEVQSIFDALPEATPVMVRARPADDDPADTALELDRQADRHLQNLADSKLVKDASAGLRDKVLRLARARQDTRQRRRASGGMAAEGRAFEGMILRAANLVFATTNSAAVERLIDERSLFDWTIVEEAGKATGGELLSPLLLSHRRLMIGDHQQLPPYGVDRMTRLLEVPENVKVAVIAAQDLISRQLKDPGIEELFDDVEAELGDFGRLCSETLLVLTLFETLVEAELKRKTRASGGRPIARRLNEQHRMHPAIARIVSDCFYQGELVTAKKKEEEYRTGTAPLYSSDTGRLPDAPIVFIDMPYVRGEHGYRGGDRAPRWSNPDEVLAVRHILRLLRARDDKIPSMAVLSPYREQVKAIREAISNERERSLKHLDGFDPAVGEGDFWGTVDSFQGDQADVVIISMVRNNGHATPSRALGFLRDERRMNVLLSRAKWRMVIVGSLEFYRKVVEFAGAIPDADISFMTRFLKSLNDAENAGDAQIVPWSRLKEGGG
jgi:hypothetical protein